MHGKSFSERFRSKPGNAAELRPRLARNHGSIGRITITSKLHITQLVQLKEMNEPGRFMLFGAVEGKLRNHGKPFWNFQPLVCCEFRG
jgi:hypothetical protein